MRHQIDSEVQSEKFETPDFKNSGKNRGEKGWVQSELWSDPCGVRLNPGLKHLRLPRARSQRSGTVSQVLSDYLVRCPPPA